MVVESLTMAAFNVTSIVPLIAFVTFSRSVSLVSVPSSSTDKLNVSEPIVTSKVLVPAPSDAEIVVSVFVS